MSLMPGRIGMYVISYDIENDRIRRKVAKELENYGRRVQYSVFECHIDTKKYEELYGKLSKLMEEEETGNIRFYNLCRMCEGRISTIGIREDFFSDKEVIIL